MAERECALDEWIRCITSNSPKITEPTAINITQEFSLCSNRSSFTLTASTCEKMEERLCGDTAVDMQE